MEDKKPQTPNGFVPSWHRKKDIEPEPSRRRWDPVPCVLILLIALIAGIGVASGADLPR